MLIKNILNLICESEYFDFVIKLKPKLKQILCIKVYVGYETDFVIHYIATNELESKKFRKDIESTLRYANSTLSIEGMVPIMGSANGDCVLFDSKTKGIFVFTHDGSGDKDMPELWKICNSLNELEKKIVKCK